MKHSEVFKGAKWIGTANEDICPVIRGKFQYNAGETAKITILGLASFILYINGKRVHNEYFLPLNSEFENRNHPVDEKLRHRAYPEQFDITKFLNDGENVIAVMLGNGWYNDVRTSNGDRKPYGRKKVCWAIEFSDGENTREYLSDTNCRWLPSYVTECILCEGETHDYTEFDYACLTTDFDDSALPHVVEEKPLDTEYYFTDCPRDTIIKKVKPIALSRGDNYIVYDVGENTTGTPVINGCGDVKVTFSEGKKDGDIDRDFVFNQHLNIAFGEKKGTAELTFTWGAFRYMRVEGNAEVLCVNVIHSDVNVTSSFECSNETLNWLYRAYVNTQRTNMHEGIPSDCPQAERRGYTGDGQVTSRACMLTLDAYKFYDKWIEDIADGQDEVTGHVQYTAPYVNSGGGPGGWSCAIVQLPYQFWKFYGDDSKIKKHYSKMLKYFDFLEEHSEMGLVTSSKGGEWCLGEWAAPDYNVILSAPFVNNYFYIKSMLQVIEIAKHLGHDEDIPVLERRIEERKKAITTAYFNKFEHKFFGNHQAAGAFALELGLGDEKTADGLVEYYEKIGTFDTGIFGTDILIRQLFNMGEHELAFKILTAEEPIGIGRWYKSGLTTIPEYWTPGRSLNHPMFGAVTACLFENILGIKQTQTSCGYDDVIFAPAVIKELEFARGHITTVKGDISVEYKKEGDSVLFTVKIPANVKATLVYNDKTHVLSEGINNIVI